MLKRVPVASALVALMAAIALSGCAGGNVVPTSAATTTSAQVSSDAASTPTVEATAAGAVAQAVEAAKAEAKAKAAAAILTAQTATKGKTTGGITINGAGAVLPNHARTPGATNPSVTQANIGHTICVSGWTATIRPFSSATTALKVEQLATGYTYKGDTATGDYEEDHLISLELGGAPSSEANLWPEPYNSPEGARVKDVVENKLHTLICGGTVTLATAQRAIATNWWIAYQTYVGAAPAASTYKAPVVAKPAPAPAPAPVAAGGGATALCNDGTLSFATHHQGACSHHGGVKVFYK
jgi:Protein of unknown function (DUF3761)